MQSKSTAKLVNRACTVGRVDVVVQSTDKNFMVPVGGAIITSPDADMIDAISRSYAGRASMDPVLDVFITLLSMGECGLKALLNERERCFSILKHELKELSNYTYTSPTASPTAGPTMRCNPINSPDNPISIAVEFHAESCTPESNNTNTNTDTNNNTNTNTNSATANPVFDINSIGSMLFYNCISGTRVISNTTKQTLIGGHTFHNWGSHTDQYTGLPYLTAACAIGMKEEEIYLFINSFKKILKKCNNKMKITMNTVPAVQEQESVVVEAEPEAEPQHA